ncbi:MAG: DUF2156 domain-containing protein [Thermodesulfobacteriota bacterium]
MKNQKGTVIEEYPGLSELDPGMRPELHPRFSALTEGVSEFTFANLYLFRETHSYRIARLDEDKFFITGTNGGGKFFMLPFGLPDRKLLDEFFKEFSSMKCVPEAMAAELREMGRGVTEDRDNFDYLYLREELTRLSGGKFHKKKNRVKAFVNRYSCEGRPLIEEYMPDAVEVLRLWREGRDDPGDYTAAKEALSMTEELQLCGGIYYVDGKPAAYTLGEEIAGGDTFVTHFEKGVPGYTGLLQFVNQAFASILPEKYRYINREQDLGEPGLREAKASYRPTGFVKKYLVTR